MLIPLRKKYRSAHKGRFKGGERPAPKKHRKKVGYEAHVKRFGPPPPVMLVVDGRTGKSVMHVG